MAYMPKTDAGYTEPTGLFLVQATVPLEVCKGNASRPQQMPPFQSDVQVIVRYLNTVQL